MASEQASMLRMNLVMYGKCQVERRHADVPPTVSVLKESGKAHARVSREG